MSGVFRHHSSLHTRPLDPEPPGLGGSGHDASPNPSNILITRSYHALIPGVSDLIIMVRHTWISNARQGIKEVAEVQEVAKLCMKPTESTSVCK